MEEYHKIQSVFKRDPENNHKTFLYNLYSRPEFQMLKDLSWAWTEKFDGTNIRIGWDGVFGTFGGRQKNSQIPATLMNKLNDLFSPETLRECFSGDHVLAEGSHMTLYGEGYGARIQKGGGNYIPDGVDFILFDVLATTPTGQKIWLDRQGMVDISYKLGIKHVPIVGYGTINQAIGLARDGFPSSIGTGQSEGLVLRPRVEMLTRMGNRIITKIKYKDFSHE